MSFRPTLSPPALLCAVGASFLVAACGGSGPKATATQEDEAKIVKFARCMREHGVNVSTSTGSGGGTLRINGSNPHVLEAAQNACKRYQPSAGKENLTPQEKLAREEAVRKFAKCMREHGINIHAATVGGGAKISVQAGAGAGGPNPESPAFQAAQKACQGLLPFKGGGPGGPGGGPTTNSDNGGKGGAGATLRLGG